MGEECYENNLMKKKSSNAGPQTNAFISNSVQTDRPYQLAHIQVRNLSSVLGLLFQELFGNT